VERVVLDPAVLVSALISPAGPPAALWRAVLDDRLEVFVCPHLLAELAGVLERPKFRGYVTIEEAQAFVTEVAQRGRTLADPVDVPRASRDPSDDYLVAFAREAGVRALVSGDGDLTEMVDPDPPVLTPAQAVDRLL
jgi:putative PIN family toxin of toxin-antitoxin system